MGDHQDANGYAAAARARCLSDIERLTRFDASSVTIDAVTVTPVTARVEEVARISAAASSRTDKGQTGGNGPSAGSSAEYQALISREIDRIQSDDSLTRSMLSTASSAAYGNLGDSWGLGDHDRTVRHVYSCGGCNGGGTVGCSNCGRTGQVRCTFCGGARRIRCSPCNATGGTVTRYADGREERNPCIWCHGDGLRDCEYCMTGWVTCSSCQGQGNVTCSTCGGQCWLTDVASFSRSAVLTRTLIDLSPASDQVRGIVLDRQGLKAAGGLAADQSAEWTSAPGQARGVTTLRTQCCEITLSAGADRFRAFALGDEGRVWDYGGLFEHLLGDDLRALEDAGGTVLILRRSSDAAMNEAVSRFCESEAHQELLLAAGRSLGWTETSTELNGTVSAAYVERACRALARFLGRRTLREMAFCGLVGVGAGLLAGLIGGTALYFTERVVFFEYGDWLFGTPVLGLLIGLVVAWFRANSGFARLGGAPLGAFLKRKGLGLFGRIGAAFSKPCAPAVGTAVGNPDEIDDEALATRTAS